jgi:hypothetical protein
MPLLSTRLQHLRVIKKYKTLQHFSHTLSLSIGLIRSPIRTISACHNRDDEDYYCYNSGRWLWDEDAQLRERYKRFNVAELKKIAAKTIGAEACVSMSKLAEGGFNKIFRLVMNNGAIVVARIPNTNAGPPFKTTASEVATMDFVSWLIHCNLKLPKLIRSDCQARTVLEIPVPKVLSWSGKAENPVESEYILMEEATGSQLGEIWDELELHDKLKIVDDIVAFERKFSSLSFTRSAPPD